MSEAHFDEYEEFNFNQEKYMHGRSGKQRTKKEAEQHTNHADPGGHSRKLLTKMVNTEHNSREGQQQKPKQSSASDESVKSGAANKS